MALFITYIGEPKSICLFQISLSCHSSSKLHIWQLLLLLKSMDIHVIFAINYNLLLIVSFVNTTQNNFSTCTLHFFNFVYGQVGKHATTPRDSLVKLECSSGKSLGFPQWFDVSVYPNVKKGGLHLDIGGHFMIFVKIGRASNYEHFFNISRFPCWVKLHPGMNLAFLSELHWVLCTIMPVASRWKPATTHQILSSFFQSEIGILWPVINTAMKNIGVIIILFTFRQKSTEKEWINILSTTNLQPERLLFQIICGNLTLGNYFNTKFFFVKGPIQV